MILHAYICISRYKSLYMCVCYLSPPEFVSFLGHPPVCVAHHGYQEVEQKDVGDHREGAVQDMDNRGRSDGVVHREIYEADTELKLGEEGDGEGAVRRDGLWILSHIHHPQG